MVTVRVLTLGVVSLRAIATTLWPVYLVKWNFLPKEVQYLTPFAICIDTLNYPLLLSQ